MKVPEGLKRALKAQAATEGKSMNDLLLEILSAATKRKIEKS